MNNISNSSKEDFNHEHGRGLHSTNVNHSAGHTGLTGHTTGHTGHTGHTGPAGYGHTANPTTSAPANRKFGNPGPLGLCAFALTTFVLSLVNLRTRGVSHPNIVTGLALGYGGLVQLLAGMWEFAVGNTFGATALSSYGGFWISYGIIITAGAQSYGVESAYGTESELQNALGFYLAGWFIFTFILMIFVLKAHLAFFLLFFFLTMTFLLLAIGHFVQTSAGAPTSSIIKAGGAFGIITAFIAWYNAMAQLSEKSNSFFNYPVGHFPWSEKRRAEKRDHPTHNV